MAASRPGYEVLAKDFLRLSPEELKEKYPEDKEIQGALAHLLLVRGPASKPS